MSNSRPDTRKKINREQGFVIFDYLTAKDTEANLQVSPDQIAFEIGKLNGFLTRINGLGKVDHWRISAYIGESKVSFDQFTWNLPREVMNQIQKAAA